MMTLSAPDRSRLAKLLGMLGSDHDGEVQAAARKIRAFALQHRLDWAALLVEGDCPAPSRPRPTYEQPPAAWKADLTYCRRHIGHLSDRDGEFIISLGFGRKVPTSRQQAWLTDICQRLRRGGHA